MDMVSLYPMLRIGKMSPYFNGYLDQYGSYTKNGKQIKTQYYLVFKPSVSYVAYNAMLKVKEKMRKMMFMNTGTMKQAPNT